MRRRSVRSLRDGGLQRALPARPGGAGRAVLLVLVTVLVASAVAACSGSDHSTARAQPRRGGTLRVAVVGVPAFDPVHSDKPAAALVSSLLFEPLTHVDPVSATPVAALASRWHADPGQTRFTFTLRSDARFHDGTAVTAGDVVATLRRVSAPKTRSSLATMLAVVRSVTAPDAHTVVVQLTRPLAVLPSLLAQPGLGVMPRRLLATPSRITTAPVGSGPFRFAGRTSNTVTLTAVRPAGTKRSSPPWLDHIELVEYPSVAAAYAGFRAGNVDVAPLSRTESEDVDRRHDRLVAHPYLAVSFYALNVRNPKLANVRFRQAIVHALDASALVRAGYGSTAQVAGGLIPPGVPAGPTDACTARCAYDPATSRRLLAAAFPKRRVPRIAIDYDDDPIQRAIATEARRELAAVGIPAVARPHRLNVYSAFLAFGQGELFRFGWVADYPSAEAFLTPLFAPGARENAVGIRSPQFQSALHDAEREPDPARQAADFGRAEAAILDQDVVVPVAQFETRLVVTEVVHGLRLDAFGSFDGGQVWLAANPKGK